MGMQAPFPSSSSSTASVDMITYTPPAEVSQLRSELAQLVPAFESVTTLAGESKLRKGPLGQSIDGVLLCVLQLGTYIGHGELYPDDWATGSNSVLTGLGIGLLVSTAVSVSTSLEDLVPAGAAVLRIAFRLGVYVSDVSQSLEALDPDSSDSWAYVVHGLTVEEAQKELDEIQAMLGTSAASKVFISAISETSVTVRGPPFRLKALFRHHASFLHRKFAQLPVLGGLCGSSVYPKFSNMPVVDPGVVNWPAELASGGARDAHKVVFPARS
ncbi:uncharacterized protein BP01DRAFT_386964 [Aspergillus saccharolyticus JOP 1030-1]|uniref:Starter acyltransferase (SAT) domain-containing protein n=1 Tax=Aspergillus saccharolyticus JOP 1030-1 TaxID=1450539 RepID=A0A318ZBL4_9EURO|nr:hypothetical protein BP01DRAFT_386964 [Aspergillus saccharolyticus JOP 1030-1]PYH40860.1 hypothetical protein BP01DRAFT_386964 [Aspergillus saccharolyticus JOP 1030-1]